MSAEIKGNVREQLLCCVSHGNYFAEDPQAAAASAGEGAIDREVVLSQLGPSLAAATTVRERLQVLTLYRQLECPAPEVQGDGVRGVVIEFGFVFGLDALAVYSDGRGALYSSAERQLLEFSISDAGRSLYERLWQAAERGMQQTVAHPRNIPMAPPAGHILISFLSERGIACGVAANRDMVSDGIAGPVVHAAIGLRAFLLGIKPKEGTVPAGLEPTLQ